MSTTRGRNTRVYVYRDGSPVVSGCAMEINYSLTSEDIEVTTVGSGRWVDRIGAKLDGGGSLTSLLTLDMVGTYQMSDWVTALGTVVRLLVTYQNDFGDTYTFDGDVLIVAVNPSSSVNDFGRLDVQWKGAGEPTILEQLQDGLMDSDGNYIWDSNGQLIRT